MGGATHYLQAASLNIPHGKTQVLPVISPSFASGICYMNFRIINTFRLLYVLLQMMVVSVAATLINDQVNIFIYNKWISL